MPSLQPSLKAAQELVQLSGPESWLLPWCSRSVEGRTHRLYGHGILLTHLDFQFQQNWDES